MASLDQLHARLILDTNRDDMGPGGELEQARVDAVADAIDRHADELFWFNRATGTAVSAAGDAALALPSGMRAARIVAFGGEALAKVPLAAIAHRTEAGPPLQWAADQGSIRLWPIPDAAYGFALFGLSSAGVPASGSESNHWTEEAYALILDEAKAILCRGPLRDPEGLALAREGRDEALARLRRETRARSQSPLRSDLPAAGAFGIVAGR